MPCSRSGLKTSLHEVAHGRVVGQRDERMAEALGEVHAPSFHVVEQHRSHWPNVGEPTRMSMT